MKTEKDYALKPRNYKPERYLSWFALPEDGDKPAAFRRVAGLYSEILKKLLWDLPEEFAKTALCGMEQRFGQQALDGELPPIENAGIYERMGACLCGLLILDAAEAAQEVNPSELLFDLFGIAPPDTGATRSVMTLDRLTLEGPQVITLCHCALRSDMSLQEMELMYEVLAAAVKRVGEHLDPAIQWLIECYIEKLKLIGQEAAKALAEDVDDSRSEILFNTAKKLRSVCQKWID